MMSRFRVGVCLLAAVMLFAHAAAQAPEDLRARLERAGTNSQLDAPGLKPWHMKLQVQLLKPKREVDATETLEEWWVSDTQDKRVYSGAYNGTEIRTADGLFGSWDEDTLRVRFQVGSEMLARNRVGRFQGVEVAIDVTTSADNTPLAKGHIDALNTFVPTDDIFAVAATMHKVNDKPAVINSGVAAGLRLTSVPPVYPAESKHRDVTGAVIMEVLIGRDGRVRHVQVRSAPDQFLAASAVEAVRHWTYKPFLLNGVPTEVDTTVTVNYNLSR